jgi:glutathione S-transferase
MYTELPILYSFKRCPYAIRARMALAVAKINHIHREINLKSKAQALLDLSPKGTVPVFHHPHCNLLLEESYDIVCYALTAQLPHGWTSVKDTLNAPAYAYFTQLNTTIAAIRQIKYNTDPILNLDQATTTINTYLKSLNQCLDGRNSILVQPSVLDLLIFPNLRQLWIHDHTWFERHGHLHLQHWLNFWSEHNAFKTIFVNQPVWDENQTPILILHQN